MLHRKLCSILPFKSVKWKSTYLESILQFVFKANIIPQCQNYIKYHYNKHFLIDIFIAEMLQLKCEAEIYTFFFLNEKKELCRVISDLSSTCVN